MAHNWWHGFMCLNDVLIHGGARSGGGGRSTAGLWLPELSASFFILSDDDPGGDDHKACEAIVIFPSQQLHRPSAFSLHRLLILWGFIGPTALLWRPPPPKVKTTTLCSFHSSCLLAITHCKMHLLLCWRHSIVKRWPNGKTCGIPNLLCRRRWMEYWPNRKSSRSLPYTTNIYTLHRGSLLSL